MKRNAFYIFIAMLLLNAKSFAANQWPNLKEVIVVSKCHLDVGYTLPVPKLQEKIRNSDSKNALALFNQDGKLHPDRRFVWTFPVWSLETALDEHQNTARRERLEAAVREGRFLWHAMPYTIQTETSDLEELVRIVGRSSAMSRKFRKPLSKWAKQTDVPEQAWALPTLLAHSGVKFLHLGINGCSKSKEEVEKMPTLCWWEGPDGSRILLGTSPQYGWSSVTPPKGWKYSKWLVIIVGGDNGGLPSRKSIDKFFATAAKKMPGVRIRFGNPEEFADAIIAEEKSNPTLPVVRGDMPDTWIHGAMSQPEATGVHRHAMSKLITLGQLDTTLKAFNVPTEPVTELLDGAYRDSGLYSEHTWGLAGHSVRGPKLYRPGWEKRYASGQYKAFDETFKHHMDYAYRAHDAAKKGLEERMNALAGSVDMTGPRVVVFNPLPQKRDAIVEVEMPKGFSVNGAEREGNKIKFLAKDLPAGGYKTFAAEKESGKEQINKFVEVSSNELKTKHFTVKFDLEKGGIASLVENSTGKELVKRGSYALGQFLHERFSQNEVKRYSDIYNTRQYNEGLCKPGMPDVKKSPYAAITPSDWVMRVKRTPLGVDVSMAPKDTKTLAKAYELRFSFPDYMPYVDITWRVEGKTPNPIPEGGWICLPFNVKNPSFRVGRIGGTIDPAKDIVFGANKDIIGADRGITVRDGADGAGVGVVSTDLPLWSLGRPGLWRYEPQYVPQEPVLFANLYNNQWNTNYPLWIPGSWSATLRLYLVAKGANEEQSVFTPAWDFRQPCVAAFAEKSNVATLLPPEARGVVLSRKGVRVTAFCPNPDGAGIVLRVWEQCGNSGKITVTLPNGMKAVEAHPVNLRGEKSGEPIQIKNGRFSFELSAWVPKSFVLVPKKMFTVTDGAELQKCIDAAASAGGGIVVVKPGVYNVGTLRLKSHVELHLEEGAVLLASTKKSDYSQFPKDVCPVAPEFMRSVVVMAWDAEDIAITGKGTIDGQGPKFYDRKTKHGHWPKPKFRPLMVQFVRCKGVRLEGVTFKDSPMWTMFIRLCENVEVDGIRIVANQQMINNDGIDFDGCKRVRVGNSFFQTGDDCIILRAMRATPQERIVCEDVIVSNCVLNSTCQAVRMGAPSDDTIRNVLFKNIKASGSNGIFFDYPTRYVRPYDEGYMDISDVVFDGFEGNFYGSAVQIVAEPGIKVRNVENVTFKNFNVKSALPLRFVGNADSPLKNIKLENFVANIKKGQPLITVATEPLTFRNCTLNGRKRADEKLVTPRGKRMPFKRSTRKSWEQADQSNDK